jgi:hypothetical protein
LINQDYVTKLQQKIDKTYRILNYTRIKPRSRPPQKEIRIFYAPRFFSGQNREKKVRKLREQIRYFKFYLKLINVADVELSTEQSLSAAILRIAGTLELKLSSDFGGNESDRSETFCRHRAIGVQRSL